MLKVGITGQAGFIGTHLFNWLSLKKNEYKLLPFKDEYFDNKNILKNFTADCDCIVHLAALNRHNDPEVIYNKNLELVDKLIVAMEESGSKAKIIFSSSTQEEKDNVYGRSKKIGREKFALWAQKSGNSFIGLIIPNVFGPFGKPFYNSVISTFSYQLVNDIKPTIEIDADLKLIYINELLTVIEDQIKNIKVELEELYIVPNTFNENVRGILNKLNNFKKLYLEEGIIPSLNSAFDINLFNTFRSYININKFYPVRYKINSDERGSFIELLKLHSGGQVSFSTTKPGITRGNHYHTRKIERFAVIQGTALIELRKIGTNENSKFHLSGDNPSFVDMPVWYTHNISNIGDTDLITVFWINEFYNPEDPDTYFEVV